MFEGAPHRLANSNGMAMPRILQTVAEMALLRFQGGAKAMPTDQRLLLARPGISLFVSGALIVCPGRLLQHAPKRPVLLVAQPEPYTALAEFQRQFKSITVPLVNQAIATSDDLSNASCASDRDFSWKLLPVLRPETAMPVEAIAKIHVDQVLVCAEAAELRARFMREG